MQLYSALPLVRARQIAADTAALAGIVVSVLVGIAVAALIRPLGDLGRSMEESGTRLSGSMTDAADALGRLPLVGDAARGPFEDASGIGSGLVQAGRDQQSLVGTIALVLGLLVALCRSRSSCGTGCCDASPSCGARPSPARSPRRPAAPSCSRCGPSRPGSPRRS